MELIKRNGWYSADLIGPDGKRVRKALGTKDIREAKDRAKVMERAAWEGRLIKADDSSCVPGIPLKDTFNTYYALHWSSQKDAEGVRSRYNTLIKFMPETTDLAKVTKQQVIELVLAMKKSGWRRGETGKLNDYSNGSINRVLRLLGFMLNDLADSDKIAKAPKLPTLEENQRTRFLRPEEEAAMWQALEQCDKPEWKRCLRLFVFLTDTGCRLGEALDNLRWSNVFLEDKMFLLEDTKAGNDVFKPLTTRAAIQLSMEKADDHPAPFSGITKWHYMEAWKYAKAQAGLADDKSLVRHSLRHTTASRLVQRGANTSVVAEILGHKSVSTTARYTHLNSEATKKAIKLLELEDVSQVCHELSSDASIPPVELVVEQMDGISGASPEEIANPSRSVRLRPAPPVKSDSYNE
jgi:integrase